MRVDGGFRGAEGGGNSQMPTIIALGRFNKYKFECRQALKEHTRMCIRHDIKRRDFECDPKMVTPLSC